MGSYQPNIRRIAIIGAGPIGIACAKYFIAENAFDTIDIFEQRSNVGGIWNLSPAKRSMEISVPQMDPTYGTKSWSKTQQDNGFHDQISPGFDSLEFESPLYEYLETNIPKQLMAYSDKPFDDHLQLFPGHADVLRYLEAYASGVRDHVRFQTKVVDVRLNEESKECESWTITFKDLNSGTVTKADYDAVVAANGHYSVPRIPDINGIRQWYQAYPGAIIHSKAYRRPENFKGQTVVVVGNSASGLDISAQLAQECKSPVYLSSRSASQLASGGTPAWREDIDELAEFIDPKFQNRAVRTKSGKVVENIDSVIFATGYFYSFPFLESLQPPIITDGFRTRDVYHHFLHIEHPTLALPVLNLKVIPFPLAENQAAIIARLWSGRLPMPSKADMRLWEEQEMKRKVNEKDFHLKRFPEDAQQINDLYHWATSAIPKDYLSNQGNGKLGTSWDQKQVWMRSKFPAIKGAFVAEGEKRHRIRTVEELGFDFISWKRTSTLEDSDMFQVAHCASSVS